MKTVAIVQSSYIPWKGYFDLIAGADEFILLDDVQYTKRDWRNRNRIKTRGGLHWLTIPVETKGLYDQKIEDVRIARPDWNRRHWQTLVTAYSRAPHFNAYRDLMESLYLACEDVFLTDINRRFILALCEILGIRTPIRRSSEIASAQGKSKRLVELCRRVDATEYLSGPRALDYLDEGLFERAGITVRYMDYSNYPEYAQLYPPFEHHVSVVDLVFNVGEDARAYMKF